MSVYIRRFPVGAELADGGVHFRVWAPDNKSVSVHFESGETQELAVEPEGYFAVFVAGRAAGSKYKFKLDGSDAYPDPASRFQPDGPHGFSQVVDPGAFRWSDQCWQGVALPHQVIYEMHIGTFTAGGTWLSAIERLNDLATLGVTVIEIMPVAEFPGRFGWGYDGVQWFAPMHHYGSPDDFRRFIDHAHALHIGVILDVVYNHLGPDGNYLTKYCADYFGKLSTDWGAAMNFDGPRSGPVREFVIANAGYWVEEFHLDGLRLDATQDLHDASEDHILAALARSARGRAGSRSIIFVAENEPQELRLVRSPAQGGYGLDAVWNDDFHHSAMVALTGHNEAYYCDYRGRPQEFISSAKYGYLYQGQRYRWQKKRRGTAGLDTPPAAFVTFIQNHDQLANTAYGKRCHELTSPGELRAMTALLLLGPGTPMLFQGQEFAASSPFLFFADHEGMLGEQVRRGRGEFLAQFPSLATAEIQDCLTDPSAVETFNRCKLDHAERERHAQIYDLHCDLLRLRRETAVLSSQRTRGMDGAVLAPAAFLMRFFAEDQRDYLLLVNLGPDLLLDPAPEPLLAPPSDTEWRLLWSSESARYGGTGTPALESECNWRIPGRAAVLLEPNSI